MEQQRGYYIKMVLGIFLLAFIFAWEQTESTRMNYKMDEVLKQKQEELYKQSQLQVLCIELESEKRLQEVAKQRGFITPKEEAIIYVNGYKSVPGKSK